MTTLKELKELDAKATKGPWTCSEVMGHVHVRDRNQDTVVGFSTYGGDCKYLHNARMITSARNALHDLIRVIELAEEALESCGVNDHGQEYFDGNKIEQALSEIRKLKGE